MDFRTRPQQSERRRNRTKRKYNKIKKNVKRKKRVKKVIFGSGIVGKVRDTSWTFGGNRL